MVALPATSFAVEIDSSTFGGLEARSIGPATMSGRVAAIDAAAEDPLTIYIGSASGGIWKSIDGGVTYEPVFDDHIQSVGAIRIDPNDPEVVWVGTGEGWTRNSVSVGDGVYKSTDGGESWTHLGLAESERITRIVIDRTDSKRVFVCATGQLWSANVERGVFRTEDGGATWEQVLAVDENTGCSDLAIDPQDSSLLYAGMWQFRRYPDFFDSGGPGSGLYRSTDGGDTWEEMTEGLPQGEKGRIAVAVAPSRPNVVYSIVEADKTALYRSDDLGRTWTELNTSFNVQARPFYFAYLVVDPSDHQRVYKPGFSLTISTDGGRSFTNMFTSGLGGGVHSDHHALWINPHNPHEAILGTDGGVYISNDRGAHWRFVGALPLSQFYHVSHDMKFPYNVFGGLQDNGNWMGPSRKSGGISNADWKLIGPQGDGFVVVADPLDDDYIYAESQGGNIGRYHLVTDQTKDIKPFARGEEEKLRFNWNTPIHVSRGTSGAVYIGAQYLFRTLDRGESWERISPDLTTDDPARQRQMESGGLTIDNSTAENNATIFTISDSPVDEQVIWAGTDDGYVQVTRDGGASWTNVTGNIPGLPAGLWVSEVEAGHHAAGTAYVTVDGHRSGDMTPYVFVTTDFGATWRSLVTDAIEGYAHVIREDPVSERLLFLGTEMGLWVSIDGGEQWARFSGNLPRVSVRGLAIHPRDNDLVIGTHGRGIYILDDVTPLRALTAEILDSEVALLPSRPSVLMMAGGPSWFGGDANFVGDSLPEAASIFFYQQKRHLFGDLKVEIYDTEGELLSTIPAGKRRGINRVDLPTRMPPPKLPPASSLVFAFQGPRLLEGDYRYKLTKGETTLEGTVSLVADPRSPHSAEDRRLQQETALRLYERLADLTYMVEASLDLEEKTKARAAAESRKATRQALEGYAAELESFRSSIVSTHPAGWLSGDEKLREHLGNLYGSIVGYDGRPTQTQLERAEKLLADLEAAEGTFGELTGAGLGALNSKLGAEPLALMTREAWVAKQEGGSGGPLSDSGRVKPAGLVALGERMTRFTAIMTP
jgi:photosystem II stability/assembly factor-like uncharacterized protein